MVEQFANFSWQPRWNNSGTITYLEENGDDIIMVMCMGTLRFKRKDSKSIAHHLRRSSELLEGLD